MAKYSVALYVREQICRQLRGRTYNEMPKSRSHAQWHELGLQAGCDCAALGGKKVTKYAPKDDPKSIFVH